jgi:hypothetical protein
MRVLPPPKAPPLRRGRLGRWRHARLATNDVSMDALFAREVQFLVRRTGKLFKDATEIVNDSRTAALATAMLNKAVAAVRAACRTSREMYRDASIFGNSGGTYRCRSPIVR